MLVASRDRAAAPVAAAAAEVGVERRAVIEVLHVRHFMRDDRLPHEVRRHHESPGEGDRPVR